MADNLEGLFVSGQPSDLCGSGENSCPPGCCQDYRDMGAAIVETMKSVKAVRGGVKFQETILEEASRIINGQRAKDYGDALTNHERIAALWSAFIDFRAENLGQPSINLTAEEVATMMILVKVARLQAGGWHRDSVVDVAGYAGCLEKIKNFRDERARKASDEL